MTSELNALERPTKNVSGQVRNEVVQLHSV